MRFFGLIPRKPDITPQWFHDHYRYPHGALGLGLDAMKHYVQSHQFDTPLLGEQQRRFEAIAEGWYDTPEAGTALSTNSHYVAHLLPDEGLFVDLPRLKWLYALETQHVELLSGTEADRRWSPESVPTTVKLLQFLSESDAATLAGDAKALGASLAAKRFVRSEPHPSVYQVDTPAYAAVHEYWWPTYSDLLAGQEENPEAWESLVRLGADSPSLVAQAERYR
ncbi:EthD domain-containing protein [Leucobacter sp. Z1108]|uniref:EthD domain-containing protein n=1 Tax=Leucobacter sp. Z1108 TaxID=3439066 RepID=UPI003F2C1AD1